MARNRAMMGPGSKKMGGGGAKPVPPKTSMSSVGGPGKGSPIGGLGSPSGAPKMGAPVGAPPPMPGGSGGGGGGGGMGGSGGFAKGGSIGEKGAHRFEKGGSVGGESRFGPIGKPVGGSKSGADSKARTGRDTGHASRGD